MSDGDLWGAIETAKLECVRVCVCVRVVVCYLTCALHLGDGSTHGENDHVISSRRAESLRKERIHEQESEQEGATAGQSGTHYSAGLHSKGHGGCSL